MIIFPGCKINLGLNIVEKRTDGYHNLETVMLEIPWNDKLSFEESTADSLTTSGISIPGNDNIVSKTLQLARSFAHIPPLSISLQKNIPMGAGMGGGSANAACFYRALSERYFPERTLTDLENDIAALGSDCAFFIRGGAQYCTGRGELLQPIILQLNGLHLLVVNPGIHSSTAEAFSKIVPDDSRTTVNEVINLPITEWKNHLHNDFEKSLFGIYPALEDMKAEFYRHGAIYASMTGSGSTMYALFEHAPDPSAMQLGNPAFVRSFIL